MASVRELHESPEHYWRAESLQNIPTPIFELPQRACSTHLHHQIPYRAIEARAVASNWVLRGFTQLLNTPHIKFEAAVLSACVQIELRGEGTHPDTKAVQITDLRLTLARYIPRTQPAFCKLGYALHRIQTTMLENKILDERPRLYCTVVRTPDCCTSFVLSQVLQT